MLLLLRLLPCVVGATNVALFLLQARNPETYPWMILAAPVLLAGAGMLIASKKIDDVVNMAARIVPGVLVMIACGYGMLLAEGWVAFWGIPLFAGIVSWLVLELLFLLTYLPTRYPVNALSHVNLALVPVTLWFAQSTSVGLLVFVHASPLIPLVVMPCVTALLFWSTVHVEANPEHRSRWALLGMWIGVQFGVLGLLLPFPISVHGAMAALLGAVAVRARRYGFMPRVPRSLMWSEVLGVFVLLAALLATGRWV
jgi:hypothetical protein